MIPVSTLYDEYIDRRKLTEQKNPFEYIVPPPSRGVGTIKLHPRTNYRANYLRYHFGRLFPLRFYFSHFCVFWPKRLIGIACRRDQVGGSVSANSPSLVDIKLLRLQAHRLIFCIVTC